MTHIAVEVVLVGAAHVGTDGRGVVARRSIGGSEST